jgi:hypothetical protein
VLSFSWFVHPEGSIGKPISGDNNVTPPTVNSTTTTASSTTTNSNANPGNVCRYGYSCNRESCWFNHPDGRAIDNPSSAANNNNLNTSVEEEALDPRDSTDLELEAVARELALTQAEATGDDFNCPCCNNKPEGCSNTETCKDQGVCICQTMDNEEGDNNEEHKNSQLEGTEAWRDEWYPSSRNCNCCLGYIYRCELKQSGCSKQTSCACAKK